MYEGYVEGLAQGLAVDAGVSGRPAIHDKSVHGKHLDSARWQPAPSIAIKRVRFSVILL